MALPSSTARAVAFQLIQDSNFLSQIHCIDYSLLVGIHHRSFNVSHYSSAEQVNSFQSDHKPLMNQRGMSVNEVHGPGIYFMGLIDMLQHWNLRKRMEHFIRVYLLFQDRYGISVVNPKEYAQRFQQRVVHELIYDPSNDSDIGIPQSPWLEGLDPCLFDSGRTRSTTLESSNSGDRLPLASPLPVIPMMPLPCSSRIRTVTIGSNTSSEAESLSTSPPEQPIRLSGGLVMEAPSSMYYTSRTSLPIYSTEPLPLRHCRRPLAPLVSSPSISSFVSTRVSDSERTSLSRCNCQLVSCPHLHSTSVPTPDVISLYNIIRTPTFPDPSPNGTMSA